MNSYRKELYACTGIGVFSGLCFLVHCFNSVKTGFDKYIFMVGFICLSVLPVLVRKFQLDGGLNDGL